MTSAAIQRFSRGTLTAGAAVWGVSVAFAFLPILRRSASPGQLPGLMTSAGLDASGPFLLVVLIPLFAVLGGCIGRLLSSRFDASAQRWAFRASCIAFFVAPWIPLSGGGVLLSLVPLVAAVIFTRLRSYTALWTASDCLLVPSFLAANLATLEIFIQLEPVASALLAAALVIAVRLLVCLRWRRRYPPALTLVAGPLAFVAEWRITAGDHPGDAAAALLIVCLAPFVIRSLPIGPRVLTPVRRLAYPAALLLYAHLMVGFSTPVLNLFEYGFGLINGFAARRCIATSFRLTDRSLTEWSTGSACGSAERTWERLSCRDTWSHFSLLSRHAVVLAMGGSAELSFVAVL